MIKKNTAKYYIAIMISAIVIIILIIASGCCSTLLPVSGNTSDSESIQTTVISEENQKDSASSSDTVDETTTTVQASTTRQEEDADANETKDYENDFTLNNLSGEKISLSDFSEKIVVLNFWATWCPPCKAEIPDFVDLYDKYKDQGIAFLGISLDDDLNALKQFVFDNNINYPIVIDNQVANVSGKWGISAIPTTFFIDIDGKILDKWIGQIPKEELDSVLKGLLSRNKA
ncbi:MAG: TlpA disulfide reductase family protein [Actinomycetota bacterium]|nr:TlpA disulfide reductase family protein [Actinomycetota bacterium]